MFRMHHSNFYQNCETIATTLSLTRVCLSKREEVAPSKRPVSLQDTVTLCFGMSILGRRVLSTSSSSSKLPNTTGMLCGIHALLKNDIRISNQRDEWVFQDMEILKEVFLKAFFDSNRIC